MKKLLILGRDGVLLSRPVPGQPQRFVPGALTSLPRIVAELDYQLVLIGRDATPDWPMHELMLDTLAGEGVHFDSVHVDAHDRPVADLLRKYASNYDLENSVQFFDQADAALADEVETALGCRRLTAGAPWTSVYKLLLEADRLAVVKRATAETRISAWLNLDGSGLAQNNTGLEFFNHMLDQLAKHGGMDLRVEVDGDLEIDEHHTIEDTALTLGQLFREALGKKAGIERYGFSGGYDLLMDDCTADVRVDFSGRPWLNWDVELHREHVGDMPTEMVEHFFKSFSDQAQCNLSIRAEGENEHHKIESVFKAFARAIKMAKSRNLADMSLPTTKGAL